MGCKGWLCRVFCAGVVGGIVGAVIPGVAWFLHGDNVQELIFKYMQVSDTLRTGTPLMIVGGVGLILGGVIGALGAMIGARRVKGE